MFRSIVASALLASAVAAGSTYLIGDVGLSCTQVCLSKGMNCNPAIDTNNSSAIFSQLGVSCKANPTPWWATNQPGYVSGKTDPNYGECLGWCAGPAGLQRTRGAFGFNHRHLAQV